MADFIFFGSIVNAVTVICGGILGLLFAKVFPERMKLIIFQALGIGTLVIGVMMALKASDFTIVFLSLIAGGLVGELIRLQDGLDKMGEGIKHLLKAEDSRFTEALVTAFLLFCVGSMTLLGTFEAAVNNNHSILLLKSMMDGFAAMALASALGVGVPVSGIFVLVFQCALTVAAYFARGLFSPLMISQLSSVGGLMIVGIGIVLLDIKKIRLGSFLPAFIIVAVISAFTA
jgi:uncharacterized membrane protein YqgA involved in biofilm formation